VIIMAGSVEIAKRIADAPALAIGGKFSKFRPEKEKASRKAEVKESEAVKQMKAAWEAYSLIFNINRDIEENYDVVIQIIKELEYTADDVWNFSLVLVEFQEEEKFSFKAGDLLSALINNGREDNYVIDTQHLTDPPYMLGYRNCKNITINGDVGPKVGFDMEGGSIIVNGDAGWKLGCGMMNGSIIVKGDAEGEVGSSMRGGEIIVGGNTGERVGYLMLRGSITVNGNTGNDVGEMMRGGSITINGDVEDWVGKNMDNGSITVNRNAGDNVGGSLTFHDGGGLTGRNMFSGGEIHINGDTEGISQWVTFDERMEHDHKGRIYHKGKLIYPK
jgi:formylmethanofuran dehydrogenase subunit C